MDTVDTLTLFIEIFKKELKRFKIPIYKCRSAMFNVNSRSSNFQDDENRCTFMYKYAASLFHFSKDCFTNLIHEYPPIINIFTKCEGNICSLTCGPGLDYLAFMAALTECGHPLPDVNVKIIAASGAWRNTVTLLSAYLKEKPLLIKGKETNLNYDGVEVIQGNALKDIAIKITNVLDKSFLVLMVKTLNIPPETPAEGYTETANKLKDFISCLQPGAMIFCIDNKSNTELFMNVLDSFSGEFLQKPWHSTYKHKFSLILPENFKTTYGLYPVSSASGLCFLWQKSETVPFPISETCVNNENMLNISCNIDVNSTTKQSTTTSINATGKNISIVNDKTYGWKNLPCTELNADESLMASRLNVPSTSSTLVYAAASFSCSSMENLGCRRWEIQQPWDIQHEKFVIENSAASLLNSSTEDVTCLPSESRKEDVAAVTKPLETCMRDANNISLALLSSKKDINISFESSKTDLTNMEDFPPQICLENMADASLESSKENSDVDPLISTMEDSANLSLEARFEEAALISSPKVDKKITSEKEYLNHSTSKDKIAICQALQNQLMYDINGLPGKLSDDAQSIFTEDKAENSGCRNVSTKETCMSPKTKSTIESLPRSEGPPLKLDHIETDKSLASCPDSLHADKVFKTKSTQTDGTPTTAKDVIKKLTDKLTHLESLTEQLLKDCVRSVETCHSNCTHSAPNVHINNCSNFSVHNPASSHLCPTKINSHAYLECPVMSHYHTNGCHCCTSVPHCEHHVTSCCHAPCNNFNSNSNQNPSGPSIVIPLQNIDSIAQIIQALRAIPTTH